MVNTVTAILPLESRASTSTVMVFGAAGRFGAAGPSGFGGSAPVTMALSADGSGSRLATAPSGGSPAKLPVAGSNFSQSGSGSPLAWRATTNATSPPSGASSAASASLICTVASDAV